MRRWWSVLAVSCLAVSVGHARAQDGETDAAPDPVTAPPTSSEVQAPAPAPAADPDIAPAPGAASTADAASTTDASSTTDARSTTDAASTTDAESAEGDASEEPTEPAAPPVHNPTLLYIGVTAASVGVVGFGILAASAVAERGRVSAGCGGMCSDADRNAADGLGIAANVAAGVALVGGVLSLIGIAVMGRPEHDEPEEREEEISVAIGPTGVVVSGSF